MQHKIENMLAPNPITTPNPKGLLPVAHPIWSHQETFTLWNSLWKGTVPMAVLWIGSLPPNSYNSPNLQTSWSHKRMPMMYIKSSIWSGFEINNWIEDQFQSSSKLVRIWIVLRWFFFPNLEIVISIGGKLWHGQVQNGVNFYFGVQFDLEGHDQSSHKTNELLLYNGWPCNCGC